MSIEEMLTEWLYAIILIQNAGEEGMQVAFAKPRIGKADTNQIPNLNKNIFNLQQFLALQNNPPNNQQMTLVQPF